MKLLTGSDIIDLCKQYNIPLEHILSRDEAFKMKSTGWYVFNLDKASGDGTHWTVCYYGSSVSLYFDSFGFVPPKELETRLQSYSYNARKIQNLRSDSCGWFCLMCIKYCSDRGSTLRSFNQFFSLFCDKPDINEHILEKFFLNLK